MIIINHKKLMPLLLYKHQWYETVYFETYNNMPALFFGIKPVLVFKDKNEANAFYYHLMQTRRISKMGVSYYNLDIVMKRYLDYKSNIKEEVEMYI